MLFDGNVASFQCIVEICSQRNVLKICVSDPNKPRFSLSTYILPPAKENIKLELILSVRKRGNFGTGAFKCALCSFHCHYTNFSIRSWVNLGNDGSRPMKWSRVEFSQDYGVSNLHIRGRLMPSLTGLKLVKIVS